MTTTALDNMWIINGCSDAGKTNTWTAFKTPKYASASHHGNVCLCHTDVHALIYEQVIWSQCRISLHTNNVLYITICLRSFAPTFYLYCYVITNWPLTLKTCSTKPHIWWIFASSSSKSLHYVRRYHVTQKSVNVQQTDGHGTDDQPT